MKQLTEKIKEVADYFEAQATLAVSGNKAAGRRARKASLELEKLTKEWRKVSLAEGGEE